MKRTAMARAITTTLLVPLGFSTIAANKSPEKGGLLPMINLPIPKKPVEKGYLGLSGLHGTTKWVGYGFRSSPTSGSLEQSLKSLRFTIQCGFGKGTVCY
jgi:hypothetical protein